MNPNEPQPTPKGVGREITPLVIQDLQMRSQMGAEKYGETLRAFNGRDALVDAYQEALDLVQYLRQAIEEKQRPKPLPADRMTAREFVAARDAICDVKKPEEVFYGDYYGVPLTGAFVPFSPLPLASWSSGESIAQEAHRLVHGERQEAYGHPIFDMTRTADMVTALLRDKLRSDARLEAEDIAQVMICVKQSRERNRHKRDNQTDTAGYSLTKEMIADWRVANPGVDPRDVFPTA